MLLGVVLLAAGGAAGAWWAWRRPPPPPPPPMPANVEDPEVRQAIEQARRAVLEKPRSADAWGQLGMRLLAQLFDRDADPCFAEAARLDPTNPRWPYARGLIAQKRDPDHALPLLRQAAAGDGPPEEQAAFRLQLAEALLERHDLDEAEQLFRAEWEPAHNNARAALGLGRVARARGDLAAAERFFRAARVSPNARKQATAALAALAGARGDAAAAASYEKEAAALPADPAWPDPVLDEAVEMRVGRRARQRRIRRLEEQHRFAEAAAEYLQELQGERTAPACVGAGLNLARLGDYDRALPLLREAIRLDPDSPEAHYTLALALFSQAEKRWHQEPGSPQARAWFREAVAPARRATELKPDHAPAYLLWGLSLKYLGDPAGAVAPLRRGVACRPELFDLQLALGEALLETGQAKEAQTYLENARRLDPDDPRPARDLERLRKK